MMNDRELFDSSMDELLDLIRLVERASTKLHALRDEDAVFRTVCDEFAEAGPYTVSIARLVEDGAALEVVATSTPSVVLKKTEELTGLQLSGFKIDLARSAIYRQVVTEGKSIHTPVENIIRELFPQAVASLIVKTLGYEGKSSILAPVWDRDQVIAVLGINAPRMVEEFIPTAESLALHISNALHAARERKLREQTERALFKQQYELTTRTRIFKSMLRSPDLDQRLETILEEVLSSLRAEMEAIYLQEGEKSEMVLRAWKGVPDDLRAQILSFPLSLLPPSSEMEKPFVAHEQLDKQGNIPDFMKRAGIRSLLTMTKTSPKDSMRKTEWKGALLIASHSYDALDEADVDSLQAITNQLHLGIDYSLQFRHAAQRLVRLEVLREIDRAIIARLSIDSIMEIVLKSVPVELGAEAIAISLFNGERDVLRVSKLRLPNGTVVEEDAFDISESLLHWFVERQEPVIIHDLTQDPRVQTHCEAIRTHELFSYLGVPLVADGKTIGILHILTVRLMAFAPEDVKFFQTLAGQAAIAIKSARMVMEIEQAERRYRGIFENAAEGIYQATLDGKLPLVNLAMAQILGYDSPDELLASVPDISRVYIDPDRRAEFIQTLERDGSVTNFTARLRRRDGTVAWISKSAHIIRDEHGQALYYVGICDDVTDRVEIEQELRASQQAREMMINAIHGILWEASISAGRFTFVSKQVESLLGYPVEEWLKNPAFWQERIHPDDREQTLAISAKAVAEKRDYELEYRMIAADGHTVWLRDSVTVDVEGDQPVKLRGIAVEITDRKRAERELQQYRDHLEELVKSRTAELKLRIAALEASANAITITNAGGKIVWANPAFTLLTGYALREAIDKTPAFLKSGLQDRAFYEEMWSTIRGGDVWHGEIINRHKDGTLYTEEMTITPVKDEDGEISHFVAVKQDISERKQAEEALHKAAEAAKAANQAKSHFLANMSHELRTPLNAIIGFSQVLQDEYFGKLTDKQAEYVNDILDSGEHLLSLINDILDLSKIEAGKLEPDFSSVRVKDILEGSLSLIKEKARKHNITLDLTLAEDVETLTITADERKLKQVLLNLLSNAAKFTPDGGAITVAGKKEGEKLLISVSDTGIGIAPEDQIRIFGEFYQGDTEAKTKPQGTGLGLAISKRIIEMHGGTIGVESGGSGKGSRFYFTIPITLTIDRKDLSTEARVFLDRLEGTIQQARRYGRIFTICQLRGVPESLRGRESLLKDLVKEESRAYDFCGLDAEGNTCLVFPEIGREQAEVACNRILSKLKKLTPDAELRSFKAVFPEDGNTIEELVQALKGRN